MGFFKNLFGGKEEKPSVKPQTLADIARGMQHAVNSTQLLIERHYLHMFDRYFDKHGKAKMQRFDLPDGTYMDVPIISLIKPDGLALDEVEIEMSVRVDSCEGKSANPDGEPVDATRTSFQCSFTAAKAQSGENHQNVIDIMMKFKHGDPPEGVARIVEYYANAAIPKKGQPPGPTGNMPDMKVPPTQPAPDAPVAPTQ